MCIAVHFSFFCLFIISGNSIFQVLGGFIVHKRQRTRHGIDFTRLPRRTRMLGTRLRTRRLSHRGGRHYGKSGIKIYLVYRRRRNGGSFTSRVLRIRLERLAPGIIGACSFPMAALRLVRQRLFLTAFTYTIRVYLFKRSPSVIFANAPSSTAVFIFTVFLFPFHTISLLFRIRRIAVIKVTRSSAD